MNPFFNKALKKRADRITLFTKVFIFSNMDNLRFLDWKHLNATIHWIYEGPPQQAHGNSTRRDYTAWRIERGSVRIRRNGKNYFVKAGQWVILPPGRDERKFSSRSRILSIFFSAQWISGVPLFEFNEPIILHAAETSDWWRALLPMCRIVRKRFPKAYDRLGAQQVDFDTYSRLQYLFHNWLLYLWPQLDKHSAAVHLLAPHNERAIAMREHLDSQSLQEPFRLHALASQYGLCPTHANRIFYAQFGTTPKRYFEQRRLRQAQSELQSGNCPIKEIAWRLGFSHNSLFSTWFLKKCQVAPRQYRSNSQQK
ncbi:MAG: hypothetical protein B9S32_04240 [Verrucomicrobia bacterium Tous-C9LFEB]|nr:MAG: hypothetical protein B9S32_04240 [Verrucomicrobia bacterium Tous-C9LFEB]